MNYFMSSGYPLRRDDRNLICYRGTSYHIRTRRLFGVFLITGLIVGLIAGLIICFREFLFNGVALEEATANANYVEIAFGALGGFVIAFLFALFVMLGSNSAAKQSERKMQPVKNQLHIQRGGIVCESVASCNDLEAAYTISDLAWKAGRLYLTSRAVEFYVHEYHENYRNFVIQLRDITRVTRRGLLQTRLVICSKTKTIILNVPIGTAWSWQKEILHLKNIEQYYPTYAAMPQYMPGMPGMHVPVPTIVTNPGNNTVK